MKEKLAQIRTLMEKCGLSAEAADQICESLQTFADSYKTKLDADYAARVEAAKKICIEETEAYKHELARRMQIYCEAKNNHIEQVITKQTAAREGEALNLLSQVQGLLEGIPAGGDAALKGQVTKLSAQVKKLTEEREAAVAKANRQTHLCEKVLQRNRSVESQLATIQRGQQPPPVTEGRTNGNGNGQPRRLDANRNGGHPRSTRRTLVESQDVRPPVDRRNGNVVTAPGQARDIGSLTPEQIAATMPEMP